MERFCRGLATCNPSRRHSLPLRNKRKPEIRQVANLAEALDRRLPANSANPASQPDRIRVIAGTPRKSKKHCFFRDSLSVFNVCRLRSWCQIGTQAYSGKTADVFEI